MNKVLTALYKIAADMSIDWTRVPKTKLRLGFTPVGKISEDPYMNDLAQFVGRWEAAMVGKDGRHYPYRDRLTGTPTFGYGDTDLAFIQQHAYTGLPELDMQKRFANRLSLYQAEHDRNFGKYVKGLPNKARIGLSSAYYNMGYPNYNDALGAAIRAQKFADIPGILRRSIYYRKPLKTVPTALGQNPKIPTGKNAFVTGSDGKRYGYNHKRKSWYVWEVSDALRRRREAEALMIEQGLAERAVTRKPKPEPQVYPRTIKPKPEPQVVPKVKPEPQVLPQVPAYR